MEFLPHIISKYAEEHTGEETELLYALNRQTNLRTTKPRMLSGKLQGRFLSLIAKLAKPNTILEIGTFTGYSALCLAEGLTENGRLYTIDNNKETNVIAREFINQSPQAGKIKLLEGKAADLIAGLDGPFDLVFIDADKENYAGYYDLVIDKLSSGGLIIADNVLWSGKVADESAKKDSETEALDAFNKMVHNDSRVENILVPLRDGLMMARKK